MQTIINKTEHQGLTITTGFSAYYEECPNDIYGIWEQAKEHQGGKTVQYAGCTDNSSKYWISFNYTPSELAREYHRQGRKNPSKEAYESLQKELSHYLEGYILFVEIEVTCAGSILASDSISTDFSYHYWNSEEECAIDCIKNNFDVETLIKKAKETTHDEIANLCQKIEVLAGLPA